jgi:preprotein translocase subunit YajC
LAQLIVLVAMFALLWLFFIAPQRRRAQAQQALIGSVEVGDEIVTVGGLIGRVRAAQDEELVLEIAPGTQVRVARRSVAAVLSPEDEGRQVEAAAASERQKEVGS